MSKKFVICELNETYLKTVKDQMKSQNMPLPENDSNITIAHKPLVELNSEDLNCDCKVCSSLK